MKLNIQDTYNTELSADPIVENTPRQVTEASFSYVRPRVPSAPQLLHVSSEVAELLGFQLEDLEGDEFVKIVSGTTLIPNTKPYAMCYGGHQFGHWAGQLGDGRAINLGEVQHEDQRWALQLKGSGATPYSRTADGLAVLRSSIREHLCSEAMYHLGVPTTRSLSLSLTGDDVFRDMLYDGNPAYEKGAVVCRVAPSFVRFGNFQIFSARKDLVNLKKLTDYTIKHFYPEIEIGTKEGYLAFFQTVVDRTLEMIIHWQRVGFVHGVMNTDNMSILGLTIDYGPYGWLEDYNPDWTPNTTDRQHRRYRYGQQGNIGQWNLYQLANALYPLIEEVKPLEEILGNYVDNYNRALIDMMSSKLGLKERKESDARLISNLEEVLQLVETDMTIFFRLLADYTPDVPLADDDAFLDVIKAAFYNGEDLTMEVVTKWRSWFSAYQERLLLEPQSAKQRKAAMNLVNPKYVLRNYMAQVAIDAADKGDYSVIEDLYHLLQDPYGEQVEEEKWFAKRPDWARDRVGCSMLSCSS